MSKHVKDNRNFMVSVDGYRRPSRKRNTAGAYRVGAKNEKEAESLVRAAIGFGSVKVTRECEDRILPHGVVKRVVFVGGDHGGPGFKLEEPLHATAPRKEKQEVSL